MPHQTNAETSVRVADTPIAIARNPVIYSQFRNFLLTGDIALSRADGRPSNRLIVLGTGSPYVHAAMVGWASDVLMLAEARQWRESHLVTLSSQVRQWPGLYDVYRVRRPFRRGAAWARMLRATGTPYGWGQLGRVALRKILGALVPPAENDSAEDAPRDCSALVNFACRVGGRTPRPDLPDAEVEPGHFADPQFARYVCTLFWTQDQVDQVL
jgi:hypothetical protein